MSNYSDFHVEKLDLENYLDQFLNHEVQILDSGGNEKAKGKMSISNFTATIRKFSEFTDIDKFDIKIINIDNTLIGSSYSIYSVNKIDENLYCSLTIHIMEYKALNVDSLEATIPSNFLNIQKVTKDEFEEFQADIMTLNWQEIIVPPEFVGKDVLTKADAFEQMCQEIVAELGAKNFEIIGKGPDRARDGMFRIEADSWIPILTNYSNLWILQCKYSKDYTNLTEVEIYKELTKVIMHQPDYYLLMTNRKSTSDFNDWFHSVFTNNKYYIPFKSVLIGQKQLEQILSMSNMRNIRIKYFGN